MWSPSWTPSPVRSRPNRRLILALGALLLTAAPAAAQQVVFDPRNHLENALQASRQLDSLANETHMLVNQARQLAASPYSHLGETSATLRDIAALAQEVRGMATTVDQLEDQFADLYPTAVQGLDPTRALQQSRTRTAAARDTARDLARAAAELERLSQGRERRLQGAVSASQGAVGQTAAIQSSAQILAVLAEDLGSMRTILLAQSRLMAEQTARQAAERAAGAEARRRFYDRTVAAPAAPRFSPFSRARH